LHLYGTGLTGQPLDIMKTVYVTDKPTSVAQSKPDVPVDLTTRLSPPFSGQSTELSSVFHSFVPVHTVPAAQTIRPANRSTTAQPHAQPVSATSAKKLEKFELSRTFTEHNPRRVPTLLCLGFLASVMLLFGLGILDGYWPLAT
jgi:hypothetical protein